MEKDPIVEEIRKHRKAFAKMHGNDLSKIVESLRQRDKETKKNIINQGPKLLQKELS